MAWANLQGHSGKQGQSSLSKRKRLAQVLIGITCSISVVALGGFIVWSTNSHEETASPEGEATKKQEDEAGLLNQEVSISSSEVDEAESSNPESLWDNYNDNDKERDPELLHAKTTFLSCIPDAVCIGKQDGAVSQSFGFLSQQNVRTCSRDLLTHYKLEEGWELISAGFLDLAGQSYSMVMTHKDSKLTHVLVLSSSKDKGHAANSSYEDQVLITRITLTEIGEHHIENQ